METSRYCPVCKIIQKAPQGVRSGRGPVHGDFAICGECTTPLVYHEEQGPNGTKRLVLRRLPYNAKLTAEEVDALQRAVDMALADKARHRYLRDATRRERALEILGPYKPH